MSPLHVSSKKGIVDVVKMLFDAGADLNAKDEVDPSPPLFCDS